MRRFSRIAIAVLGLIAASIACDYPKPPSVGHGAWSSDSQKLAVTLRNSEVGYSDSEYRDEGTYRVRVLDISDMSDARTELELENTINPSWLPDGRLSFSQWSYERGWQRKIANADGSNQQSFTFTEGPYWSPDGQKSATIDCYTPQRCVINWYNFPQNTPNSVYITLSNNANSTSPEIFPTLDWSLDSQSVICSIPEAPMVSSIYVVTLATGDVRRITPENSTYLDRTPTWLSDGKIAFLSNRPNDNSTDKRLYVMNPDGTGIQLLTDHEAIYSYIVSPDATQIAYSTKGPSNRQFPFNLSLYVMNSDGTQVRSFGDIGDSLFFWSPNGKYLTYESQYSHRLVVLDATTGQVILEYELLFTPSSRLSSRLTRPLNILCITSLSISISLLIIWLVYRRKKRRNKPAKVSIPPSSPAPPSA